MERTCEKNTQEWLTQNKMSLFYVSYFNLLYVSVFRIHFYRAFMDIFIFLVLTNSINKKI